MKGVFGSGSEGVSPLEDNAKYPPLNELDACKLETLAAAVLVTGKRVGTWKDLDNAMKNRVPPVAHPGKVKGCNSFLWGFYIILMLLALSFAGQAPPIC